jgi:hypothetical protein
LLDKYSATRLSDVPEAQLAAFVFEMVSA